MNCCRPFTIFLIMTAAMSSLGDTSGLYMILVTAFYGLIFVEMYCCIQLESAYKEYSDHMKVKSLLSYKNWNENNGSVNFKHYQKSKNLWPACIRLKGPTRRKCHISPSHKKPIIRVVGSETLSFPEVHTVHCTVPRKVFASCLSLKQSSILFMRKMSASCLSLKYVSAKFFK